MPTRRHILGGLAAAIAAPMLPRFAWAADPLPLRVVGFAGASNLPFWIGQDNGFFAKEGVAPTFTVTPNSTEMAKNLVAGTFDLALTSIDNVVAYDEGQGEVALGESPDFVALFGVDDGMLSVMAAPGIHSIPELKGKTVSVDAMTTGYAFVLRECLKQAGVAETDLQWAKAGGGQQRLDALLKGEQAGTLLNAPLDLAAETKGFVRLEKAQRAIGPYQGIVGMGRRATVAAQRPQIIGFIRGFHAAVQWLYDPANRDAAIASLAGHSKGMSVEAAGAAVSRLLDPAEGIFRTLQIRRDGVATVLRLRSQYAQPQKTLDDPGRYIDESLLQAALKG